MQRDRPALAVFSGQNSLQLNLPSDELSLKSALKVPLAPADNRRIPILMLLWNGMKNSLFALGQNQQVQKYLLEGPISLHDVAFAFIVLLWLIIKST